MNEAMESNYEEYRPQYRPISTESGVTTTDTEVVAAYLSKRLKRQGQNLRHTH